MGAAAVVPRAGQSGAYRFNRGQGSGITVVGLDGQGSGHDLGRNENIVRWMARRLKNEDHPAERGDRIPTLQGMDRDQWGRRLVTNAHRANVPGALDQQSVYFKDREGGGAFLVALVPPSGFALREVGCKEV